MRTISRKPLAYGTTPKPAEKYDFAGMRYYHRPQFVEAIHTQPTLGIGTQRYGRRFVILKDVFDNRGNLLFKEGMFVKGTISPNGAVAKVRVPKYGRPVFANLAVGTDVSVHSDWRGMPIIRTSSFDADLLNSDLLEDEVASCATGFTKGGTSTVGDTVAPPSSPTFTPETITPPPPSPEPSPAPPSGGNSSGGGSPQTVVVGDTQVPQPTPTPTPTPIAPPQTIVAPIIVPQPEIVAPMPVEVIPADTVIPSGGGGGGMMGGGGGGGGSESAPAQAARVEEKKIFGLKPKVAYTLGAIILIAGGYWAYKKYGK